MTTENKSQQKLIHASVYFLKNTNYCYITKLMKLLHLLDFTHFKQVGRSVTNLDYYAWDEGPVPKEFYSSLKSIENAPKDIKKSFAVIKHAETLDRTKFIEIKSRIKFDEEVFTPRELTLLKNLAFQFKELRANEISEYTHLKNKPWDVTKNDKGMYQKIDYELAVDNQEDSLPLEVIKERQKEIDLLKKIVDSAEE